MTNSHPGMTLRDYFAGQAMQGFATHPDGCWVDGALGMARCSYEWAAAMLVARDEQPNGPELEQP